MTDKVRLNAVPPEVVDIARRMFKAYSRNSDGVTYDKKPIPPWESLGASVQEHWCAAATEAIRYTSELMRAEMDRRKPAAKTPCPDCAARETKGVVDERAPEVTARPPTTGELARLDVVQADATSRMSDAQLDALAKLEESKKVEPQATLPVTSPQQPPPPSSGVRPQVRPGQAKKPPQSGR